MAVVERDIAEQARRFTRGTPDGRRIGQLLLQDGKLTERSIKVVALEQKRQGMRFGDAAVRLGLISELDVQRALSRQLEYPCVRSGESALSSALIAAYEPSSPQAEALRALRTQLMLHWFRDGNCALAVVAARSGTGSSILSANLAILMAQIGARTLLIDANLRKPRQHELFGMKPDIGLASVLAGRGAVSEALVTASPFDNLLVLCAGAAVPNPQELLGRGTFANLIETAPANFDAVIVDVPPLKDYADAQMVAARAGSCLIVARRHHTRVSDVMEARAKLAPTGATVLGAVLCD
jgi:protein-tyrosine kinase